MLRKTTQTYATAQNAVLECDIYDADGYPPNSPVFLFFHSNGLVGGARVCIPPWLVQACYQRQWPLLSPSYRLLPQSGGTGLLQDASAAYNFARNWGQESEGSQRQVIVGGASAGFFMASLIAQHLTPAPAAMLCITGIPTFRHSFFNSSTLLTPQPIKDEEIALFVSGPVETDTTPDYDGTVFVVDRLLPSGLRNPAYIHPARPESTGHQGTWDRGCLYDYYLYKNAYLDLVGDVDLGLEWAKNEDQARKLQEWPFTVFIQGDEDSDVSTDVIMDAVACLGPDKAMLCLAKGQGHLFEATSYLEDEGEGMDTVRKALEYLDRPFR